MSDCKQANCDVAVRWESLTFKTRGLKIPLHLIQLTYEEQHKGCLFIVIIWILFLYPLHNPEIYPSKRCNYNSKPINVRILGGNVLAIICSERFVYQIFLRNILLINASILCILLQYICMSCKPFHKCSPGLFLQQSVADVSHFLGCFWALQLLQFFWDLASHEVDRTWAPYLAFAVFSQLIVPSFFFFLPPLLLLSRISSFGFSSDSIPHTSERRHSS